MPSHPPDTASARPPDNTGSPCDADVLDVTGLEALPPDGEAKAPESPEPPPRRVRGWRRAARWGIHVLQALALAALATLCLAYAVETRQEPLYGWVRNTPVESYARAVNPFLRRQQHYLTQSALDLPLSAEENAKLVPILHKMTDIQPSHLVITDDGQSYFGRLRSAATTPDVLHLQLYDGQKFSVVELSAAHIRYRSTLVSPDVEMTPRDYRFLLRYNDMNHYLMPPYLFSTSTDFAPVQNLHFTLARLADEFQDAFSPVIVQQERAPLIHVCLYASAHDYVAEVASSTSYSLVNSTGFCRKSDSCLILLDPESRAATAAARIELPTADPAQNGAQTARDLAQHLISASERQAVMRHEGAHQLAAALGVLPTGLDHPLWIEEGLAQYCEASPFEAADPVRLAYLSRLRQQNQLLPLEQLMDYRTSNTFDGDQADQQRAYAESWLLFYHLMNSNKRARFLSYLADLSRHAMNDDPDAHHVDLMNILETTPSKLMAELEQRLPPPSPSSFASPPTSAIPPTSLEITPETFPPAAP